MSSRAGVGSRRRSDPARAAACDALLAVERDGAYLNLLLPRMLRERAISGRDAAFATEIGYGAARRSGVLLPVLSAAGGRDATRLDPEVRAVLILGAYQILHTRVPARAAVGTSVDLVREVAGPRPSGLVNAVLRRVAEKTWPEWIDAVAPADPLERVAFTAGYPAWIAAAIWQGLGGGLTELAAALDDAVAPSVHLVARPGRIDREALLAAAGPGAAAGALSPYAVHLASGDPAAIAPVRTGAAAVQDEGSQLVALAAAGAPVLGSDTGAWLDPCAGPGGKAALLEGLLPDGGRLLAADRSPHRAALVAAALTRSPVIVADGRMPAWPQGRFDRVLLDAPCSGLGALRRRPEARWRKQRGDIGRLAALQRALLAQAVDAVRPGGVVGYATCSPHPAETTAVVDAVLHHRADLERLDAWSVCPQVARPDATPGNRDDLQLWPHRHGTDAMFLALLRRR